ncbi:helix-turn-helix transcriptional regulator [Nocardiopsis sp. CNT-189]|uniref:helix-turn-helix domain-containing protein n=1 Tax=Nocardiopsis oceanisediminis TaxID=2816862 RepID=UPI003B2C75F7
MLDGMVESGPLSGLIAAALKRERARTGYSISELARRAEVSKSTVSQLEAGAGNPSVETLWALSTALGIPFSRLVDPPMPRTRLVRRGEAPAVPSGRADYTAALLSSGASGARRDIYLIEAEPGDQRESAPHPEGTVEHVVLVSGRASVGPADSPSELSPGDYLCYPGDEPHVFRALDPGTSAVLVSEA